MIPETKLTMPEMTPTRIFTRPEMMPTMTPMMTPMYSISGGRNPIRAPQTTARAPPITAATAPMTTPMTASTGRSALPRSLIDCQRSFICLPRSPSANLSQPRLMASMAFSKLLPSPSRFVPLRASPPKTLEKKSLMALPVSMSQSCSPIHLRLLMKASPTPFPAAAKAGLRVPPIQSLNLPQDWRMGPNMSSLANLSNSLWFILSVSLSISADWSPRPPSRPRFEMPPGSS